MPQWQLKHRNGESYPSEVVSMELDDACAIQKLGWEKNFDWRKYFKSEERSNAHKLLVIGNDDYIQGAIAYQVAEDHVYVDLLESAPTNRHMNVQRQFTNVADVLLGVACMRSFEEEKDGFVCFTPKSGLYEYYKRRFKAKRSGSRMYIDNVAAIYLIRLYYT